MRARRVALVIGQLQLGGAERQLYELAMRLDRARYEPLVVCLSSVTEPFARKLREGKITVDVLPRSAHWEIARAKALAGILRAREIDLTHSFLVAANAYTYAARWFMRGPERRPYIASSRICSRPPGMLMYWVNRRAFHAASAVIANSRAVMRYTSALYGLEPREITVIHNGIALDAYAGPGSDENGTGPRAAARADLGIPGSAVVVGTIGRIAAQKNLELFLEMASRLVRAPGAAERLRFVVAGDGPARGELEASASARGLGRHVIFTGACEDVPRMMSAIDLFVLSSDAEGLPNAVMEAMAAGRAVVATSVGGTEELVADGICGHLVPPGDAAALTEHVGRLLWDPRARREMGRQGRARVEREFSVEKMVASTAALYDEVMG